MMNDASAQMAYVGQMSLRSYSFGSEWSTLAGLGQTHHVSRPG